MATLDVKRILLINLAFIGDVILSTPVARALKGNYPNSRIDMLVVPLAAEVAAMNPYVDRVIEYDKKGRHRSWSELCRLLGMLRAENYDLAVATNFAARGAMVAWASGAKRRLGYKAQHAQWFLTDASQAVRDGTKHEAENYLDVLQPLALGLVDTSLELRPPEQAVATVQQRFVKTVGEKWTVLCPVGSYARKSWTREGYAQLLRELAAKNVRTFLIGGRREEQELREIQLAAGGVGEVLAGTLSLAEVTALLARSDLLVSVDTGPLHIGQGVGVPTIGLYGPTDPAIWGPRGKNDHVFYSRSCQPCWGKGDCVAPRCMKDIDSAEVVRQALAMLGMT